MDSSNTNDPHYFKVPEGKAATEQKKEESDSGTVRKPEGYTPQDMKLVVASKQTKKSKKEHNEVWDNATQFVLTAVGLAVGLGNIWKFPYLAYAHGGAAFLIPYIFFGVTFGLPVLYMEFLMGQYSRANPSRAFYRYAPAFQGVGLLTAILAFLIGSFYALVIAWAELFLVYVFMGQSWKWTECDNYWNDKNCVATSSHNRCRSKNSTFPYATANGTCTSEVPGKMIQNGAQQFFQNYIMVFSKGVTELGDFNWPVIGCVIFFYILCALTLWKGIRILEKTSYVTVPLPYIVILIFFGRAFFLEGSWDGIKLYLFQVNFSKLATKEPWIDALTQVCFSLAIGCGALISLASHNKPNNNCFRDAILVTCCDTLMSVFGGAAVFGTLGYLAKRTGRTVAQIVEKGPNLIFISYSEATSTMPVPWLWNGLFFLMVFLLGFSTMVAIVEFLTNFILTSLNLEGSKKWRIVIPLLFTLATNGSLLATGGGSYWFVVMAEFIGSSAPCIVVFFEAVLFAYIYRWPNVKDDMEEMWGKAPQSTCGRLFSRFSPVFRWQWLVVAPLFAFAGCVFTLWRDPIPINLPGGTPIWVEVIGWSLNLLPVIVVPIFCLVNMGLSKRKNIPLKYLLMPSKRMPSHDRYYKTKGIPPPDGWVNQDSSNVNSAMIHTNTEPSHSAPESSI